MKCLQPPNRTASGTQTWLPRKHIVNLCRNTPPCGIKLVVHVSVAGYFALYEELDLLPDVAIAEEARESEKGGEGSRAIFRSIMVAPMRYSVLDDYTRCVNVEAPKAPAFLNGDTELYGTYGNDFELDTHDHL